VLTGDGRLTAPDAVLLGVPRLSEEMLEPRARGDSLTPSLEASVYDPAWMLARQWQLAEFRGQDAAFPVSVAYSVDVQPLAGYQPPGGGSEVTGQYPLEAFAWPRAGASADERRVSAVRGRAAAPAV
jgi:hypothetical protein